MRKIWESVERSLASAALQNYHAAVRHDLPHMPSLGVSSLDSGRRGDVAASFISPSSRGAKDQRPSHPLVHGDDAGAAEAEVVLKRVIDPVDLPRFCGAT
jgi:hypothetical protein